jgi:transcriptional regulator with XRE-family HTH domain
MQNAELLRNTIGARVKALRQNRSLTLKQLAEMAEYDLTNLSKLENGKIGISESALWKLSNALRVPPADLLTDTDLPPVYWVPKYGSPDQKIPTHRPVSSSASYVIVQEDAMKPRICKGDIAIIDPEALASSTGAPVVAAAISRSGRQDVIVRRRVLASEPKPRANFDEYYTTEEEYFEAHYDSFIDLIPENEKLFQTIRIPKSAKEMVLGAVVEIIAKID